MARTVDERVVFWIVVRNVEKVTKNMDGEWQEGVFCLEYAL